jgi:hypothetical protein
LRKLQHLFAITIALLVTAAAPHIVRATDTAALGEEAVDRMIDLNKKAFADIQNARFEAARYRLEEALVIGETAGLENDEMTARTYVHLACVYLTGFKNRDESIRQFILALKINPKISITIGLETPALKSAYLFARKQMGLPPSTDVDLFPLQTAPPEPDRAEASSGNSPGMPPNETPKQATPTEPKSFPNLADPDLLAQIPAPLYCPLPFEIQPGKDQVVRCLTRRQQKKSTATFFYRTEGSASDDYVAMPMDRSAKGWLVGIIPGEVIHGRSISYYVEAQILGSQETLYFGRPDMPNTFIIKTESNTAASGTSEARRPISRIGPQMPKCERCRQPGAWWASLGGGTGTAYHGRDAVGTIPVRAGFSPATLFQLEPEIGYQWTETFSLSLLGRYQYAPEDSSGEDSTQAENDVRTSAVAGFVRAQLAILSAGHLQVHTSGGVGFGNSFLAVVNKECSGTSCRLNHSDNLHGGPVGLTLGASATYHLSQYLGIFVDVKEIATLPKFMALTEINVGMTVSTKATGNGGNGSNGL